MNKQKFYLLRKDLSMWCRKLSIYPTQVSSVTEFLTPPINRCDPDERLATQPTPQSSFRRE